MGHGTQNIEYVEGLKLKEEDCFEKKLASVKISERKSSVQCNIYKNDEKPSHAEYCVVQQRKFRVYEDSVIYCAELLLKFRLIENLLVSN